MPTVSATGSQTVVISGTITNQPVISPTASGASAISVVQTLTTGGANYTSLLETQLGGELITLTNGANLTLQGVALGVFYGNPDTITAPGGTITGLHGATTSTPSYDAHMQLIALGNDTLTVDTVNENFGLITIGGGDTLTIANITTGGNAQQLHGLINYGLITIGAGGDLNITATNGSGSTVANFYNAGWIVDNGGTLNISSPILDGANTAATATGIDGYIILQGGATAILSNTVASHEEVLFNDTSANTLQIAAGTLFAGTVAGFGASDTILVSGYAGASNATLVSNGGTTNLITGNGGVMTTITLAGSVSGGINTGTNASGQEFIQLGGSTLANNTSFGGGTITLGGTNVPVLTLNGTAGVTGAGTDVQVNSSLAGNGTIVIDNGATLALGNSAGADAGITVLFGTHGSAASPNTLILNDNPSGFAGQIKNFGVNDEIVVGANVLAEPGTGQGLVLSYNSATGVLTVEDTSNSTGSIVSSTNLTIAGTSTGALSTGSFVALEGTNGIDIELAPAAASFTFSASGTGSFESPTNYTGKVAPGDIITAMETVTIAAGVASVSSGGVAENGSITVASGAGLVDAGSLAGTGTLSVLAGASATLTGNTTLGSITDAGTLVLGGNLGATGVTLTTASSNITIASNFTDTGTISGGKGTVTVAQGVAATFNGGVSVTSILDAGTIAIGNTALSSINMGAGPASKVIFAGNNTATNLTSFGSGDDIVVGGSLLPIPTVGSSISLNYAGASKKLTVTLGAAQATITVGGTAALSKASFVALQGTDGVNIELVSGLAGQSFTFAGSTNTSFEAAQNYIGGIAPGDSIVASEVVTIASGTASVASSGVTDNGTITVASGARFVDNGTLTGTGTLALASGAAATLAAGSSVASIIDAGTLVLNGALGGTVDMHGDGAHSVVDFTGTSSSAKLINFGTTDDIILGSGVLPTGSASLSYNTASGVLTVTEGASTANVTVSGVAGNTLSSASFVALQGTNGLNIELASGLAGQTFTFTGAGGTSFEAPADYAGGVAPGDSIVAGEVVTIASGTASVTGAVLVDNGTINVGSKFVDTGSITGTGTLNVGAGAGASATLTGNTTLGSINDAGTLVLGGQDAAAINIASGAQATIASNFSDSAAITGAGTLTVNNGVAATLAAGSSIASIIDAGTLVLNGALGGTVDMHGNGAGSVVDFAGADVTNHVLNTGLINFGTGDTIILGAGNFSLSGTTDQLTQSYSNGQLVVTDTTSHASVTINVSLASGDSPGWLRFDESTGQLKLTLCFYPGTRIATPEGEVAVEALKAGDLVMTANGAKPVRWVGQSHVHTGFADPLRALPIRIKAGALGGGLPVRDLLLSPDHALFIDGILVQAGALVNGVTILREHEVPEQFTYYHVELATHELLLAEGVQAESFVDNVDRMHFHNWDEREAPVEAIEEMPYPRAKSARQVPMALRRRLDPAFIHAA